MARTTKPNFLGAEVREKEIEVGNSLKSACVNTCGVVEEGTGFLFDAFSLAREEIKPMKIESRKETAIALAQAVTTLTEAGFTDEEASRVILGGIEVR